MFQNPSRLIQNRFFHHIAGQTAVAAALAVVHLNRIEIDRQIIQTAFLNHILFAPGDRLGDLRQFAGYRVEEHIVMTHDNLKAVNTEADPWQVKPVSGGVSKVEDGKLTAVLGKHSWNVIRLKKA